MITLSEVNKEIEQLTLSSNIGLFSDGLDREPAKRGSKKHLAFLFIVRNYLETNPSEQYCKGEVERLRALIDNLGKVTVPHTFFPPNFQGDPVKYREEKMGITMCERRLKRWNIFWGVHNFQ